MKKHNYHTHCELDDGKGPIKEYVKEAIKRNFASLGFSCHTPMPTDDNWHIKKEDYPSYIEQIETLKEKYKETLVLYKGLELDYFEKEETLEGSSYKDQLDFTIGAVHLIFHNPSDAYLAVDGPIDEFTTLLNDNFNKNIKAFAKHYFNLQMQMIDNFSFDFLAHCTLMEKHNQNSQFFNQEDKWYQFLASEMLEFAKEKEVRIELNTGAIARGRTKEPYPSLSLLKTCYDLKIPIVINSDAHHYSNLDFYFDEAKSLLKEIGYKEIDILENGRWREIPII